MAQLALIYLAHKGKADHTTLHICTKKKKANTKKQQEKCNLDVVPIVTEMVYFRDRN